MSQKTGRTRKELIEKYESSLKQKEEQLEAIEKGLSDIELLGILHDPTFYGEKISNCTEQINIIQDIIRDLKGSSLSGNSSTQIVEYTAMAERTGLAIAIGTKYINLSIGLTDQRNFKLEINKTYKVSILVEKTIGRYD